MKKSFISLFLLTGISFLLSAQNFDKKFKGWKKAETNHFTFIYEDSSRETAEEYAKIADEAWNKIGTVYSFPRDKTNVFITDRTNTVNAYTYFAPIEIGMFTTPCYISDFGFREEWKKLFFTHELVHVANIEFENKIKWPSICFGPFAGAVDVSYTTPGWALEGLTTVLETELTDGGRGRSPYFELKYKAPTLENSFISYSEIGQEAEPPVGQAYVMGYLIMRSIADRYGLGAIADIQRNKGYWGSYENALFKVLGVSAESIYKDVKKSLVAKYADERKIPEGKIISPRVTSASYFQPAVILDDGTYITLRTFPGQRPAVVKYNPSAISGSNYLEDSKPEEDLNTVLKETILFENSFGDEHSVTADKNEIVYASMPYLRNDRNPGYENENAIFKWTSKDGLKRLTKGTSYFWPRVSRNGEVLVALKQKGLNFILVRIDTETGSEKELLEIPGCDIVEPSVNDDGTKIAFLKADGKRAVVCVTELSSPEDYEEVANTDEDIIDPAFPSWNSDGKLLFCSNERGRLEVFEVTENEDDEIRPVVSDPVGALWAYKSAKGVYYYSYSSDGYVLKIKPETEWGIVPDFYGPSLPGEKICFGSLQNDYPDFNPYPGVQERVPFVKEEKSESNKKKKLFSKETEEEKKPVEVAKIQIKQRDEKFVEMTKSLPEISEELSDEKKFIPLPDPIFYIPMINLLASEELIPGIGYAVTWMNPKLQSTMGLGFLSLSYYPDINNFDMVFADSIFAGPSELDFIYTRTNVLTSDQNKTVNDLIVGYILPLYNRQQYRNYTGLLLNFYEDGWYTINNRNASYDAALISKAGIDFHMTRGLEKSSYYDVKTSVNAVLPFIINDMNMYYGAESKIEFTKGDKDFGYSVGARGRYLDIPGDPAFEIPGMKYGNQIVDCSEPFRLILNGTVSAKNLFIPIGDIFLSCDSLFSITREKNLLWSEDYCLKLGYKLSTNQMEMKIGATCKADYNGVKKDTIDFFINMTYGLIEF